MRTTLRIDDDLMRELKERARREAVPLTRLINRLVRRGLESRAKARKRFRQRTHSMGVPKVDLTKAMTFAAALEDEEIMEKLARALNEIGRCQHLVVRRWRNPLR
jgi:hypothetical protein